MKILIASTLYYPTVVGGAEKIAQAVAEALLEEGHEVIVVTINNTPGTKIHVVNGVKVYYVGIRNIYWPQSPRPKKTYLKALWHAIDSYNPWMALEFKKILKKENPCILNTHAITGLSCSLWKMAEGLGIPIYHTIHDYSLMCPKGTMFKRGKNCAEQCGACWLYSKSNKRISACVKGVIGVSRFALNRHLQAGFFKNAVLKEVIYNALPGKFMVGAKTSLESSPLSIGFVGRLVPQKGIEELLDTITELKMHKCTLIVAGSGSDEYEKYLKNKYASNVVRFVGFVNPIEVYKAINVLVVPSLWEEPFGLITLESYSYGIPVIASDRGALPEIVENGRTGFVYESSNPDGLKNAILRFILDPSLAKRMEARILEKANNFGMERLKNQYCNVLVGGGC